MSKNFFQFKKKTIIYVNFSPYENAGKILDFLLQNFDYVFLYSFNFHMLGKDQETTKLKMYHKGKLIQEKKLFQFTTKQVPISFLFLFLPFRSFVIFLQILSTSILLKKHYGKISYFFSVNAFTAWVGNILRSLGIANKTIFWVWDYYPPLHENKIVMVIRWIYWQFDKISAKSNKVIFLNRKLHQLRKDIGILPTNITYTIVPIGTDPVKKTIKKNEKKITFCFLGVIKKSQGLDLLFNNLELLHKSFSPIKLEIIGSGPDELYFKNRAKKSPFPIVFHGFVPSEKKIMNIVQKCSIGIATYIPEASNLSYYGDPSKIKLYLSCAIPVITTNVFQFSEEIESKKAGIVIDYHKKHEFIQAIQEIMSHYKTYQRNALQLAQKYFYKEIYIQLFSNV